VQIHGSKQLKGSSAETYARHYLEEQGLRFLEANFASKTGEIDLIMRHRENLVFIEVRFRTQKGFATAAESVTYKKQQKLRKTAQFYLLKRFNSHNIPCRFDVVAIDCSASGDTHTNWIKNAF